MYSRSDVEEGCNWVHHWPEGNYNPLCAKCLSEYLQEPDQTQQPFASRTGSFCPDLSCVYYRYLQNLSAKYLWKKIERHFQGQTQIYLDGAGEDNVSHRRLWFVNWLGNPINRTNLATFYNSFESANSIISVGDFVLVRYSVGKIFLVVRTTKDQMNPNSPCASVQGPSNSSYFKSLFSNKNHVKQLNSDPDQGYHRPHALFYYFAYSLCSCVFRRPLILIFELRGQIFPIFTFLRSRHPLVIKKELAVTLVAVKQQSEAPQTVLAPIKGLNLIFGGTPTAPFHGTLVCRGSSFENHCPKHFTLCLVRIVE